MAENLIFEELASVRARLAEQLGREENPERVRHIHARIYRLTVELEKVLNERTFCRSIFPQKLIAYSRRELSGDEFQQLRDHLVGCPHCMEKVILLDLWR